MDIFSTIRSRSIKLKAKTTTSPRCRTDTAQYGSLMWTFDPGNHYLHPRLMDFVYSKQVLYLVAASILPSFALSLFPRWMDHAYNLIFNVFLYIPFLTLIVLSFNRDALGFILKSSELWIKVVYGVMSPTLFLTHYHFVLCQLYSKELPASLGYARCSSKLILEPLLIIVVGSIDAIPKMTHEWKAILVGLVAALYTKGAIEYQFLTSKGQDYKINIEATDSEISLHSLSSNVCGMLAIFLWKQAVDVIRNKGRCISISYRPYLRWAKPEDNSALIDLDQISVSVDVAETDDTTASTTSTGNNDFSFVGL